MARHALTQPVTASSVAQEIRDTARHYRGAFPRTARNLVELVELVDQPAGDDLATAGGAR